MSECRICLETGDINEMISPCNCRGSSQWVHPECLNEWRMTNQNPRSRDQCEICLFNYIISNDEPKETFIIPILEHSHTFLEFFLSIFVTFVFGNLIMFLDEQNKYKTLKDFELYHLNDKFHVEDDKWFIWIYYQGLASFILNCFFYSFLNIMSLCKVIRKKYYFNNLVINNVSSFLYTFNFILLVYLSKLTQSTGMLNFWSPLFVTFHFTLNRNFLLKHNKILKEINDNIPNEIVSSFHLNPLNEVIPITITEYVQHNNIEIEVLNNET